MQTIFIGCYFKEMHYNNDSNDIRGILPPPDDHGQLAALGAIQNQKKPVQAENIYHYHCPYVVISNYGKCH